MRSRRSTAPDIWVLPGFIDMHGHIRRRGAGDDGRVRVQALDGARHHDACASRDAATASTGRCTSATAARGTRSSRRASFRTSSPTPRSWDGGPIDTPEQARKFVQWVAKKGADGIKILGAGDPDLRSRNPLAPCSTKRRSSHLGIDDASRADGRGAHRTSSTPRASACAAWSIGTDCPRRSSRIGRFRTIRPTTTTTTSSDRFGQAGRLWKQAAPPGSAKWNAVIDELMLKPSSTSIRRSRSTRRAAI